MSSIDLNKLGLPTHPRTKEIIEEDYPNVSLANRMKLIQKQFAERQNEVPKDTTKPPENVKDVFYNFESVFNRLMGLLKRFVPTEIKKIDIKSLNEALMSYSQLASVYNAFVAPQLQANEIFRREVFGKLDQLASVCGLLIQQLESGDKDLSESQFNYMNAYAQAFNPNQDLGDLEYYANIKFTYTNILEQIRRDALTRNLRPVSFPDEQPLPGQVRKHIPTNMDEPPAQAVGEPVERLDAIPPQRRQIQRRGQEPEPVDIEPEEPFLYDVVGVDDGIDDDEEIEDVIISGPQRPPVDTDGLTRDEEQQVLEEQQYQERFDAQELADLREELNSEEAIARYLEDPRFLERVGKLNPDDSVDKFDALRQVNRTLFTFINGFERVIPQIQNAMRNIRYYSRSGQNSEARVQFVRLNRDINIVSQKYRMVVDSINNNSEDFLRQLDHSQPTHRERFIQIGDTLEQLPRVLDELGSEIEEQDGIEIQARRDYIPYEVQRYREREERDLQEARRAAEERGIPEADYSAERREKRLIVGRELRQTNEQRLAMLGQIYNLAYQVRDNGYLIQRFEGKLVDLNLTQENLQRAPLGKLRELLNFIENEIAAYQAYDREQYGEGKKKRRSLKKK